MVVSKCIEKLIKTKVTLINEPFTIRIKGTPGGGYDSQESAYAAYEKLKVWAENLGASVDIICDKYGEIYSECVRNNRRLRGLGSGYMLIEITDPALRIIEDVIDAQ